MTAMTFKLPVWPNPPSYVEPGDRAQLITKVLSEMEAQMTAMKEEAIEVEASKMTTKTPVKITKAMKKQPKSKSK